MLDLFSGCGGLSLGFHTAGFNIVGAVENDPHAARSHAMNFHSSADKLYENHALSRDITTTEPDILLEELGVHEEIATCIDVIIGGPPCQSFARVGRAKLREIAAHPDAFLNDPRSNLYLRYLYFVEKLKPLAILVENVPDVLNYGGHNVPQEMCEVLAEMGYICSYTLLNAAYYGVPQMRERMFLIAYTEELGMSVSFPEPSHWVDLPAGYQGSRQVALRAVTPDMFSHQRTSFYVPPPEPSQLLHPAVTAQEALGDLPPITLHLENKLKRGVKRVDQYTPYLENASLSPYGTLMRSWPGFEETNGFTGHVTRYVPRDYAIFRRMNPGDQYPQAYQHAVDLFYERVAEHDIVAGTPEYKELWDQTVPPYDNGKFPNKWRKMEADKPARTLMAHLGKDGYSHIHYDSDQARIISVREAARLQSFPDGFIFAGSMNPAFRQIGNAVPPLLALKLACVIGRVLRKEDVNARDTGVEAFDCV